MDITNSLIIEKNRAKTMQCDYQFNRLLIEALVAQCDTFEFVSL